MRTLLFTLLLFAFAPSVQAAENAYICPMHPHISGKAGDICPICGMTLVPKVAKIEKTDQTTAPDSPKSDGAFHIDPTYVQALGVKTAEVSFHDFGKALRAFGKIVPSTRREYAIDTRTAGWIVDLAADAVGDHVKKGDLLFTYYSPDLMTAQSDFLIGGSRVGNARQRLRLYGMDEKAISELKNRGSFFEKTPFYAPIDGTLTNLPVRKGSYVKEGGQIMTLQDFSTLWVNVDVPIRDVGVLTIGTPATVTVPETGDTYKTVIDFIHPVADPQSRTATIRLLLDNQNLTLKPETYIDAVFEANVQSRLAVPEEAVLYGKMGAYVMKLVSDGYFKPVMIKPGITANGLTEVKTGLSSGQRIVTSGQFMLDAESNLRGGMNNMEGMEGMDHGKH